MPRISFILPVYNMEAYLPRVLRSLRAQTLPDFEAILVNDGSRDRSGELCAQAATEDSRFRFINQPNSGVAAARNAALDTARGEYLFFLDPDDWIETDAAEILYHTAREADADLVLFGVFHDYYNAEGQLLRTTADPPPLPEGVYRGEPCKQQFDKLASSYLVITKLFRRACVERAGLRFPCRQLGEDGLFYTAFCRTNPACVAAVRRPLYHYTIARKASLSNSYHPERLQDNFYLSNAVWDTVAAWGLLESPKHLQKARFCTVRDLQMGIKNLALSPLTTAQRTAWLREALRDPRVRQAVQHAPLRHLKVNDKVKLLLCRLHLYRAVVLLSSVNQHRNG